VVGVAEAVEFADIDHGMKVAARTMQSSVTPVTLWDLCAHYRRRRF
jgi:hypothetical protein